MFSAKLKQLEIRQKRFIFDPLNLYSLGSALLINIIHWAILYIKLGHTSGTIVLHYNVVYGTNLVDKAKYVFIIPATALLLLVVNTILGNFFYRKEKLAAYFINFANIAIQLIFIAASITIILYNE
jgi:hypothetical protein